MKKLAVIVFLFTMLFSLAWAGGFELYEFGARSSALGGATVARAWDASTIFYNPSGLAFLGGTRFYGGVTLITATNIYAGPTLADGTALFAEETYESVDAIHTPIGIYFSHQFTDDLVAGIGVTNPFGLGLEWDKEEFPGRGVAFNSDLKSFYISPVVAYKITDELSIGGGLDLVLGTVTLERSVYPFAEETPGVEVGRTKIDGSSELAVGFTASAMYQTEELGLGFLYRHSVTNKLKDGDVSWEYFDTPFRTFAESNLNFKTVDTELTFPNFFSAGVYYRFLENMGAELDFMWYGWSVFDELLFKFKNDAGDVVLEQTLPEDYEDSIQFRVGIHYDFSPELQLRLGYIYDQTPQPVNSVSPLLPDNDRHDFSIGLGYTLNSMQFDVGYMLVDFGERSTIENGVGQSDVGFDGTYSSVAHLFFVSYGIVLD